MLEVEMIVQCNDNIKIYDGGDKNNDYDNSVGIVMMIIIIILTVLLVKQYLQQYVDDNVCNIMSYILKKKGNHFLLF